MTNTTAHVPETALQIAAEITGRHGNDTPQLVVELRLTLRDGLILTTNAAQYRPAGDRKTVLRAPDPNAVPEKPAFADDSVRNAVLARRFPAPASGTLTPEDLKAYSLLTDGYLGQETGHAVAEIDDALRTILAFARNALHDLHKGDLPTHATGGFSSVDSALRNLPVAVTRIHALADAATYTVHRQAHADAASDA